MLHVVTAENSHLYKERLSEMYRLRYEVFIEECGWRLPCEASGEMDQFDTDDAAYFLYFGDHDEVAACFRVLPTTGPHLMTDVFRHLCAEGVPCGPSIFEGSRAAVNRGYRREGIVWQSMMAGVYEYCLLHGVNKLTGVFDLQFIQNRIRRGVDFRPLGPPVEVDGEMCIACYRPISIEGLQVLRDRANLKGPVLTWIRDLEHAA